MCVCVRVYIDAGTSKRRASERASERAREKEREREGEMTLANVSFRKSFRTNAVHSFEAYSSYPPTLVLL